MAATALLVPVAFIVSLPIIDYFSGRRLDIGTGTTVISKPLGESGVPDYQAALNDQYGWDSVPKSDNFAVTLLQILDDTAIDVMGLRNQAMECDIPRGGLKLEPPNYTDGDKDALANGLPQSIAESAAWTRDKNPLLARWLDENVEVLSHVSAAIRQRKYLRQDMIIGDPPHWEWELPLGNELMTVRGMFRARGMLRLAEGKIEDAIDDYDTISRISTLMGTYRSPLYWIYACGDRVGLSLIEYELLTHPDLTVKQWDRISKISDGIGPIVSAKEIIGESFRYQILFLKTAGTNEAGGEMNIDVYCQSTNHFFDLAANAAGESTFQKSLDRLSPIDPKKSSSMTTWDKWARYMTPRRYAAKEDYSRTTKYVYPKVEKLLIFECSAKTLREESLVARSIARYRLDNDRLPETLDDLVPTWLTSIPADSFTGELLSYKKAPSKYAFTVYSFGQDGIDDESVIGTRNGDLPYGYELQSHEKLGAK
ncbi:MAG: hypothetical protein C0478_03070 [Planctomyces sp.]|nr:hypothetical protein [Planctomyces sp.]